MVFCMIVIAFAVTYVAELVKEKNEYKALLKTSEEIEYQREQLAGAIKLAQKEPKNREERMRQESAADMYMETVGKHNWKVYSYLQRKEAIEKTLKKTLPLPSKISFETRQPDILRVILRMAEVK